MLSVCCAKNHDQKLVGSLTNISSHGPSLTKPGGNLEAEAETNGECCLQALSHSLPSLAYTTQDHLPQGGTPQWAGTSHINHQSWKCSTDLPAGQAERGQFSVEVPSSHVSLVDKLTSTGGWRDGSSVKSTMCKCGSLHSDLT